MIGKMEMFLPSYRFSFFHSLFFVFFFKLVLCILTYLQVFQIAKFFNFLDSTIRIKSAIVYLPSSFVEYFIFHEFLLT